MELCGIGAGKLGDDDQFAQLESGGDDLFSELGQVVLVSAAGFADQSVQAQALDSLWRNGLISARSAVVLFAS